MIAKSTMEQSLSISTEPSSKLQNFQMVYIRQTAATLIIASRTNGLVPDKKPNT